MLELQRDVDLAPYNTFGFAVTAERFVRVTRPEQLPEVCAYCDREKQPLLVLGGGSNLVLGPRLPGVVAKMEIPEWQVISTEGDDVRIVVGAGELWHNTVERSLNEGLYGLENLALIPGTVGASPIQNIGAYGAEVGDYLHSVRVYDRQEHRFTTLSKQECAFGYRDSVFKSGAPGRYIITAVEFALSRRPQLRLEYGAVRERCHALAGDGQPTPHHVFAAVCQLRRSKLPDPAVLGNVGSFFKNPVVSPAKHQELLQRFPSLVSFPEQGGYKLAAGWLIEQCGWKGKRLGQVGVYERQALVLVNLGGGNREQIERLAGAIRESVYQRFGVMLEAEPRFFP